ncbi:MAG: peptide deformylase [Eubacteriales bacterium]
MALRDIVMKDDPVLGKKSRPVEKFDRKLWDLLDDMKETLGNRGLGLAAPQIGILRCVALVVNDEGEMIELVNPKILSMSGEEEALEGCLSYPGYWGFVSRPTEVTVEAQDRNGKTFQVSGEGIVARCFCHEIEHLEGVLYTSHCERVYDSEELEELENED